jgi:thiol-disulfide isomerase/thioredoxin
MPMHMNDPLPELDGATEWLNSEPLSQGDCAGAPVLFHWWAISCPLCKQLMPKLIEWREQYGGQGLKLVGVHMPRSPADTDVEKVRATAEELSLTHPQAVDNLHKVTLAFGNEHRFVPAFYLFDADGRLRAYRAGEKAPAPIEEAIERVLKAD